MSCIVEKSGRLVPATTAANRKWHHSGMGYNARSAAPAGPSKSCRVMIPTVPPRFHSVLVPSADGLPGRYKVRLPHGHTVYEVRIDGEGQVTQVDGRMVHSNADLGFRMEDAVDVEAY